MKLEIASKWISGMQWMLGSDVLNARHCVVTVGVICGRVKHVLSVGVVSGAAEFAASGKGRVGCTTEY